MPQESRETKCIKIIISCTNHTDFSKSLPDIQGYIGHVQSNLTIHVCKKSICKASGIGSITNTLVLNIKAQNTL